MKLPFSSARTRSPRSFSAARRCCRSRNSRICCWMPRILSWNVSIDLPTTAGWAGRAVIGMGMASAMWYCASGQKVPTIAADPLIARIDCVHCVLWADQCCVWHPFEQYQKHLHRTHRIRLGGAALEHSAHTGSLPTSSCRPSSATTASTSATVNCAVVCSSAECRSASPTPVATKHNRTAAPARIASRTYGSTVACCKSRPTNCSVEPAGIARIARACGRSPHAESRTVGRGNVLVHVLMWAHGAPAPATTGPGGTARTPADGAVTIEVMQTSVSSLATARGSAVPVEGPVWPLGRPRVVAALRRMSRPNRSGCTGAFPARCGSSRHIPSYFPLRPIKPGVSCTHGPKQSHASSGSGCMPTLSPMAVTVYPYTYT
jgi:hypothetical protein